MLGTIDNQQNLPENQLGATGERIRTLSLDVPKLSVLLDVSSSSTVRKTNRVPDYKECSRPVEFYPKKTMSSGNLSFYFQIHFLVYMYTLLLRNVLCSTDYWWFRCELAFDQEWALHQLITMAFVFVRALNLQNSLFPFALFKDYDHRTKISSISYHQWCHIFCDTQITYGSFLTRFPWAAAASSVIVFSWIQGDA